MLTFKNSDIKDPKSFIKIYDGDELIRDFVVCRDPNGIIGTYDRVNERFLPFTNCVEVRSGDYTWLYTKADFENLVDGNCQYIDTGCMPKTDAK